MSEIARRFHKEKKSSLSLKQQKEEKKKITSKLFKKLSVVFTFFFFLICASLYIATIKGVPGNPEAKDMLDHTATKPFELSPERGRYAHTIALAENGSLSLSRDLADAVYPDVGYVDGRFYSFFAPGISILAVPFYQIGRLFNLAQVATYSVISVFALGTIFFLYRIAKDIFKLSTSASLLPGILFGFGSTSWSYATTLYQHHLTTFFIISSFYAVWKFSQKGKRSFVWGAYVWLAYAAAFTVDYPNMLLMLPVMVYFFLSSLSITNLKEKVNISLRPAFLFTGICFVLLTALHGYYNYSQLGDWKRLSGNIVGFKTIKERQLTIQSDKAAVDSLQNEKGTSNFFREDKLPFGLYELSVAPDKGLFFFSPLFLLGIVAILSLIRKMDVQKAVLLSVAGVNLFLYASFGDPWGGWAFGPRYLILSMSVLSLFISMWLANASYRFLTKLVAFFLFAFSSAVALLGVLTTNSVPPKVEADYLHLKYGFFMNWDYFTKGESSSFLYNTYLSSYISLQQYFILLYTVLMAVFFTILFLVPKARAYED